MGARHEGPQEGAAQQLSPQAMHVHSLDRRGEHARVAHGADLHVRILLLPVRLSVCTSCASVCRRRCRQLMQPGTHAQGWCTVGGLGRLYNRAL